MDGERIKSRSKGVQNRRGGDATDTAVPLIILSDKLETKALLKWPSKGRG